MLADNEPFSWRNQRVFVTGGTGFVGANLVQRLLERNAEVHLLVRPTSDWRRLQHVRQRLTAHPANLLNANGLKRLLGQIKPDCCFHLASYGSSSWHDRESTIIDVTCHGIANLIGACRAAKCPTLVNVGTSSEYGLQDHAPAEDEPLSPNSVYAAAKAFATHRCQLAARAGNLHAPTARLYSAYGPWESTRRFIPALLRAGLDGAWPPLVDPEVARDFVYVDDVVDLLLAMAQRTDLPADAVYNVGTGVQTTIGDAVAATQQLLQVVAEPHWGSMPDRSWDTTSWVANPAKAVAAFDWHPREFAAGLKLTADWLRQHPDWQ